MAKPRLLTTAEAAELLGLTPEFFRELAGQEDWLRPITLGAPGKKSRLVRWSREDIEAFHRVLLGRMLGDNASGRASEKTNPAAEDE